MLKTENSHRTHTSAMQVRIPLLKKMFNCSCNGMYQWFDWHFPGSDGFTGYFLVDRRELPWPSPTKRQLASNLEAEIAWSDPVNLFEEMQNKE